MNMISLYLSWEQQDYDLAAAKLIVRIWHLLVDDKQGVHTELMSSHTIVNINFDVLLPDSTTAITEMI